MTNQILSLLLSSTVILVVSGCDGDNGPISRKQAAVKQAESTFTQPDITPPQSPDVAAEVAHNNDPVTPPAVVDTVVVAEVNNPISLPEPVNPVAPVVPITPTTAEIPASAERPLQKLAKYVNTMRGANSSGDFTRGNTFPATAVPFGFNFWTPVNRQDKNWFYQFRTSTGYPVDTGTLITQVTDFAVVHEPSPWIGNRQSLSIMPIDDVDNYEWYNRGESYSREDEVAQAHYYSLKFSNGTKTEITPTDRAAVFRFTVPAGKESQAILFDLFAGRGAGSLVVLDQTKGILQGHTDFDDDKNAPPLYYYVTFNAPITDMKNLENGRVKTWVAFDTTKSSVIEMKIGTSFISREQAKANLDAEVGSKNFDQVKEAAEALWDEKLNMFQVEGATEDQKTILYSNIYRAFLYPNAAHEFVDGKPFYNSPYTYPIKLKPGKTWVNNGFWDTYRTTWPLYALFDAKQAGEMIDGFVNAYKDGGWVPRWSGPDYRDSMVSTSSDIIFADAFAKGVKFDFATAYESMVKNATTYSKNSAKGRKGMEKTPYYGYSLLEGESVAWSLEAYLNDFGVAEMAKALGHADDAAYFYNSAISYVNLFDKDGTGRWAGGFFREKNKEGKFGSGASYPAQWGHGYTEGNAWSYAFLAPQDGQGLANLFGGRSGLKDRLDTFFTTKPSTEPGMHGSYWTEIHEIIEARAVHELANVGEYQHSNQPVHHSLYMYNYANSPASGQKYLRDVMDNLYYSGFDTNGKSNGSGYIGDEDNGEQSAWYVFSAMGFYPVSVGRAEYAIGAPYFPKASVAFKKEDGSSSILEILAPGVSSTNRYVQSVTLNGRPITKSFLLHSEVVQGGKLEFQMGPNPSATWGRGKDDVPTSITQGNEIPKPLISAVPAGLLSLKASLSDGLWNLSDRNSQTVWANGSQKNFIEANATGASGVKVKVYTMTSPDYALPLTGWVVKGSNDGSTWAVLDTRKFTAADPIFKWPSQLRPFAISDPKEFKHYRIEFDGEQDVGFGELEFLAEVK